MGLHYQVLRRIGVGDGAGLVQIVAEDHQAAAERLGGDVAAAELGQLAFYFACDGVCQERRGGHQHHLAVGAVLGLGEKIRRHEGRIGALVRNHQHLGGPAGMSMAAPRQSRETWPLASVT